MLMDGEEAVQYTQTDPERRTEEKEFHVGFSKADEMARVDTSIRSMMDRLLTHSEVEILTVTVYNDGGYRRTTLEEFDGDGSIVYLRGKMPIGSLKVNSSSRNSRGFAQVISKQEEVDIQ